jgi:PAS domain S-box-containing protein
VIEGTPNPIFVKDVEGRYLLANSAAARLLGHSKEEITGRLDSELVATEIARQSDERHRLVLESEQTQIFERELTVYGELRHFLYDKGVYHDAKGQVAGVFAFSRDITERQRAEEELRTREEFLRSLVVASPLGIFHTNLEGRLVYVTPKFCEISGLTEEETLAVGAARISLVVSSPALSSCEPIWRRTSNGSSPIPDRWTR